MRETGSKDTPSSRVDFERLEQTLMESIKLMRKGRREMERMRRKPRQDQSEDSRSAA
jgi:hypothetical protein